MADYKKMYYILCAAASEALDQLPDIIENTISRKILEDALLEAEEVYVSEQDECSE